MKNSNYPPDAQSDPRGPGPTGRERVVEVRPSGIHGRGVFSQVRFSKGDVIERCPVLVIPVAQKSLIDKTSLYDYYYEWGDDEGAIALGFGSLYNHSSSPNATHEEDTDNLLIIVKAAREIMPGEEVTIDYGRLWFTPDDRQEATP